MGNSKLKINTIYNEDCIKTMEAMEDNFIDLTVTSPPYDNLRKYNGYRKLQRWCNNRHIFASCRNFDDYNKKEKYNNTDNQQLNLF